MVRSGVDEFVESVDHHHCGVIERGLEYDTEVANLVAVTEDASGMFVYEHGVGVWRRC